MYTAQYPQGVSRLCGVMAMAEAVGGSSSYSRVLSPFDLRVTEQGEQWVLRKHVRVGSPKEKDKNQTQKRIYESNEKSGIITLTIFTTGHFFISQGPTLVEGFSLISAKSWMKIGKKLDWLLFGSKMKDEFRMFKVQFDGDSKNKAQENCDSCFQRLQHFLCSQNESVEESSQSFPEQRITVAQVAQGMVMGKQGNNVDVINPCPTFNVELCTFLKLCFLDQNFPGFVEAVENELYKLIKN
ncbi:meiotic recombination protein REC114 [Hyla sarda]|uniref:meiotic recombination protein REC114 n=1 Tax=Hyla sarda TaxID=327740 RepID=UPI0024C2B35C|nr:meiotic recombination protein REC114 [Hyla sarda]